MTDTLIERLKAALEQIDCDRAEFDQLEKVGVAIEEAVQAIATLTAENKRLRDGLSAGNAIEARTALERKD